MSKTYFAYTRVSTVKQGEGVSLEAQKDAITNYALKLDLPITGWFEEKETAAKQGRPVFSDLITRLRKSHADGVIMHKIDRSARNLRDWATVGELQDKGVDVHFAAESVDFTSRGGRLTADIQAVIAADFIRNLKEETRKGIKGRLKQGLYPHKAPLGYIDTGRGNPKEIDPVRAPYIKDIFTLYATGQHSLPSLSEEMYKRGLRSKAGRKIYKAKIEQILSNPFYIGRVLDHQTGQSFEGQHEAIIKAALFKKVQDVKANRYRKKSTKHTHLLRGLFKCQVCANAMIPERQKGHVYYRCHTKFCPSNSIREEAMELAIHDALECNQLTSKARKRFAQGSLKWLDELSAIPSGDTTHMSQSAIEVQMTTLTDKLLSGVIDDETYLKRKQALQLSKQEVAEAKANQLTKVQRHSKAVRFLELAQSLTGLYKTAHPHEKRQIIELCFSNRTVHQKNVEISTQDWLKTACT